MPKFNQLLPLSIASITTIATITVAPVHASTIVGFQGPYDPSNFTLDNFNANGSVDTFEAPDSITLAGGNNSSFSFGQTNYTTAAAGAGTVMFDFNYESLNSDGPFFDPFGVILNGVFTQLSENNGPDSQNGTFAFDVQKGDTFGFAIQTVDNIFGNSQATVSNFKAPAKTPEPTAILGTIAIGALGIASKKRKQNN